MASAKDSFEVALDAFKQDLKPAQRNQFKHTTLQDVKIEMANIQASQRGRKALRALVRIQPFLEAMTQFGFVVEVFLNDSPFLSYVWGPIKLLLQTASCTVNSFDVLLDAYDQIGEAMPLLAAYKDLFEHDEAMHHVLVLMFEDILHFHRKALCIFQQPMWQRVLKDLWQDFKSNFDAILTQLKRHKELIESHGTVLHLRQYREDRKRLFDELDASKRDRNRDNLRSVVDWVAAANTPADHDAAMRARKRYMSTGNWVLKLHEVSLWIHSRLPPSSTLWLYGKPGAGKTVLASVIIEYLLADQRRNTAYFYCKHNDPAKNTYQSVLKGILGQLVVMDKLLLPYFRHRQETSCEVNLSSTKNCEVILDTALRNSTERIYLVIDGLDECPKHERKDLMSYFADVVKACDLQEPGKLRILFLSQNEVDIANWMRTATKGTIQTDGNRQDIGQFVGDHCNTLHRRFTELEHESVQWIARSVCERADGMFLFAKLVMENLTSQRTFKALKIELLPSNFPQGLQQAYDRIVSRILDDEEVPESDRRESRKLLQWLICARRPLAWREIQAMVSVDPDSINPNSQDQEPLGMDFEGQRIRGHVKELCGSLVDMHPGDRVEFVHQTAAYYLSKHVFLRKAVADMSLATICLQYLTLQCFQEPTSATQGLDFRAAREGYFALEDYATAHWGDHVLSTVRFQREDMLEMPEEASEGWEEFGYAIEGFQRFYDEDFALDVDESLTQTLCQPFDEYFFYDDLIIVAGCARAIEALKDDQRDQIQLGRLRKSVQRHRGILERLFEEGDNGKRAALQGYYGHKWFKCPKLTCYFFHDGFDTRASLRQHADRHERPYCCPYEDCIARASGFASPKLLEKHKKKMHSEIEERPDTFGAVVQHTAEPSRGRRHRCEICPTTFTRKFNLRMHMASHNDQRQHPCAVCGKSFVRNHDRTRHERTLHQHRRSAGGPSNSISQ